MIPTPNNSHSSLQTNLSDAYILDSNVLIAAWHDLYPKDLFPGFWKCLEHFMEKQQLLIADKVKQEITGPSELIDWIKQHGYFTSTETPEVAQAFSKMENWVQSNQQFSASAKNGFASAADGWLVAYAYAHQLTLATNEKFDKNVKKRVPIPNLCEQFKVKYCNTTKMLRYLGAKFELNLNCR
ncbi:MAG: DUF4411 family protein [Acidimicrobiaceae bacterium]|nr:DUF4411 family protein [Acidimicrobiaceae bacterium]